MARWGQAVGAGRGAKGVPRDWSCGQVGAQAVGLGGGTGCRVGCRG